MNDNLTILKTDLKQVVPVSLPVQKEIKKYLTYVDQTYRFIKLKELYYTRNLNSDASVKIRYLTNTKNTALEKNELFCTYDKVNIRLKTEMSDQDLINDKYWVKFFDGWYELFKNSLKTQYDVLWSEKEKLNIEITVYAGISDANLFNLCAVGLIKSITQSKIKVSGVLVNLKDYLKVELLPFYIYAVLVTEEYNNSWYMIFNPGGSDIIDKKEIKGFLSGFLIYPEEGPTLKDLVFETYGIDDPVSKKTVSSFFTTLKEII